MIRLVLAATLLATQSPSASALFRQGNTQYVGIHYWLQNDDGSRLTEARAQPARQYSVHLRSNVAGFLVVFLTADGSELTPRSYPPYGGLELRQGGERIVFLFARSQTEVVRTSDQAIEKLARLGPALISETLADGVELGTYVVNRKGAQPSAAIRLTR